MISSKKLHATEEEVELCRVAREFTENEKKKLVKWFVSRGEPLPSDEAIEELVAKRVGIVLANKAQARDEDRARTTVQKGTAALIPYASHPLHADEGQHHEPTFEAAAANGMQARQKLFNYFAMLTRTVMLRQRVEARVKRNAYNVSKGVGSAASRTSVFANTSLVLASVPGVIATLESTSRVLETVPPSGCDIEFFREKTLKVPFEFKLKDYKHSRFPEHPFANADPPEDTTMFPAGESEVAEPTSDTHLRPLQHFQQPLVTMETYPLVDFPLTLRTPWTNLVENTTMQRVDGAGIKRFCPDAEYEHTLPALTAPLDLVSSQFVRAPVPRCLYKAKQEDVLSDTEEDAADVPQQHPASLEQIMLWLPQSSKQGLSEESQLSAISHDPKAIHSFADEATNKPVVQQRGTTADWIAQMCGCLPLPMQKQF